MSADWRESLNINLRKKKPVTTFTNSPYIVSMQFRSRLPSTSWYNTRTEYLPIGRRLLWPSFRLILPGDQNEWTWFEWLLVGLTWAPANFHLCEWLALFHHQLGDVVSRDNSLAVGIEHTECLQQFLWCGCFHPIQKFVITSSTKCTISCSPHLCSANNWVTCGKNRDRWMVPLESSNSVAVMISFISFSDGTQPKYRRIVPISRTSTVLLPWWSNMRNASAIFFSKSVVIDTAHMNEVISLARMTYFYANQMNLDFPNWCPWRAER